MKWVVVALWLLLLGLVLAILLPEAHRACPEGATSFAWYCFLKDWQEGVGAAFGLLGLMIVEVVRRDLEDAGRRAAAESLLAAEADSLAERLMLARENLRAGLSGPPGAATLRLEPEQRATLAREAAAVLFPLPAGFELLHPDVRDALIAARLSYENAQDNLHALLESLRERAEELRTEGSLAADIVTELAAVALGRLDRALASLERARAGLPRPRPQAHKRSDRVRS